MIELFLPYHAVTVFKAGPICTMLVFWSGDFLVGLSLLKQQFFLGLFSLSCVPLVWILSTRAYLPKLVFQITPFDLASICSILFQLEFRKSKSFEKGKFYRLVLFRLSKKVSKHCQLFCLSSYSLPFCLRKAIIFK